MMSPSKLLPDSSKKLSFLFCIYDQDAPPVPARTTSMKDGPASPRRGPLAIPAPSSTVFSQWFPCVEALIRKGSMDFAVDIEGSDSSGVPAAITVLPAGIRRNGLVVTPTHKSHIHALQTVDVSLFAVPSYDVDGVDRAVFSIDLKSAEVYTGRGDIARLLRELYAAPQAQEHVAYIMEHVFDPVSADGAFALVADSVCSVDGQRHARTVHFFSGGSVGDKLFYLSIIQEEISATMSRNAPPVVRLASPTAASAPGGPASGSSRGMEREGEGEGEGEDSWVTPEQKIECALKTQIAIINKAPMSNVLPADILHRLRHLRRKPEDLLRRPQEAWTLLVRAARYLDRYMHDEHLKSDVGGSVSSWFDTNAQPAAVTGEPSSGSGEAGGVHAESPATAARNPIGYDSDSDSDYDVPQPNVSTVKESVNESSDDSFEFMDREYTRAATTGVSSSANRSRNSKRAAQQQQPVPVRENYTFVRKHQFAAIAGRYFTCMCDKYTADAIFDQLTRDSPPRTIRVWLYEKAPTSGISTAETQKEADESEATSLMMVDTVEKVLSYDSFERYAAALSRPLLTPPAAWESLRDNLTLDARELVVKVEEYVEIILTATAYVGVNPSLVNGEWQASQRDGAVPLLDAKAVCTMPLSLPNIIPPAPVLQTAAARPSNTDALRIGRNIRTFVADRDRELDEQRRHDLYDSDTTFVFTSSSETEQPSHTKPHHDGLDSTKPVEVEQAGDMLPVRTADDLKSAEKESVGSQADQLVDDLDDILDDVTRSRAPSTAESEPAAFQPDGTQGKSRASFASRLGKNVASLLFKKSSKAANVIADLASDSAVTSVEAPPSAAKPPRPSKLQPAGGAGSPNPKQTITYDTLYGHTGLNAAVVGGMLHEGAAEVRTSGTLIITDRNVYFQASNKNEVLILPLDGLPQVELCRTQVKTLGMQLGRTSDNGLQVGQAEIRRVVIDSDVDANAAVATPLSSLFTLATRLKGTMCQVPSSAVPKLNTDVAQSTSTIPGVFVVRPAITFVFSKMKDLLLSRGQERAGGRRLVVKRALDELVAAHRVSTGFESVMRELVGLNRQKILSTMFGATQSRATSYNSNLPNKDSEASLAAQSSYDVSPWLLHAASGGVSFSNFYYLPFSVAAWKHHLTRDRRDEVAFPRRLHLYSAINVIRTRALLKSTGRVTQELSLCNNYFKGVDPAASEAVHRFMLQDDPRWMLRLAAWMCHDRVVHRKRFEELKVFDRRRFKYEFDLMLDNFFFPLNTARHLLMYIYAWETPMLSFLIYMFLLLVSWHNFLPYTFPICMMLHAAAILTYGAVNSKRRAAIVKFCTRPRTARGKTFLQRLRNFRDTLANNQVRMHKLNSIVLKIRSLYTWRDPDRTRFFVFVMLVGGIILTVIPFKWLFTLFLLLQLTKPLRSHGAGLFTIAFRRFWDGLPVPSVSDPVYAEAPDDSNELMTKLNPDMLSWTEDTTDVMSRGAHTMLGDGVQLQILR